MVGALMIIAGIGLFFYPDISNWYLEQQTAQYISEFQDKYKKNFKKNSEETDDSKETEKETSHSATKEVKKETDISNDKLYQEIITYNSSIFENGQSGFKDAWSYEQSPISLEGLSDGKFGYIQIPAMDVTLPLYVGASDSNMAKGAVILGQTSIPVGGENTNSVIAGHRGWSTGNFFLDIEEISVGDMIYITNPWQTLAYCVKSIDVIDPYDSDAVKIQEGRDMVTLATCHPYMSRGKYRYVVYCDRNKDAESDMISVKKNTFSSEITLNSGCSNVQSSSTKEDKNYITASDGTVYESSNELIQKENLIRRICGSAIILIILLSFFYIRIQDKKTTDY